ncbi:retrovirus-related pol polyprotein from transposon TNT 1-94 [Tanacetum coccineum]
MVFNSPCLTDKKELIHHEVEMVINSPWIMPLLGTKGLASPEQTATVGLFNKATKTANYMVLEGVLMKNKDAASSRDIQLICAEFSSIQVKTQADWMLLQSSYFNPQVPTGRVVVPTGRYVVPAGKVIIIVSPGRLSLVPTGRVLSPARHGLVRGLPKLKFEKDHLCSTCSMGKIKKKPHKPKSEDTNQEKLYLLHMDLCGPMRVASVNGKKYILVIVDDYSRFTWVKCLKSKDEASNFIIKFLKMIQVRLKVHVQRIRTNNGTEFVNQTLHEFYEKVGISHETFVARSPQQNGVIERRNRTLIEAARTRLIYAKAPLFLWAESVDTACYTQNRSIIRLRHDKTPYELLHDKLPDLSFFHVFGALCYLTNDSENLGKLQPKADIGIFIGYAPTKKAFQIYNRRTRRIIEIIHVDFDELTAMASEHSSSGPALHEMTPATISSGLVPNPPPSKPFIPPSRTDWDLLFQSLFDELLTPLPSVDCPVPKVIAPIDEVVAPVPAVSTGSPSSTIVNQYAPSPSNSQTTSKTQSPIIPNDVEEYNHDLDITHMNNDPFFGIPILENESEASSSLDGYISTCHATCWLKTQNTLRKWTKDHLKDNINR